MVDEVAKKAKKGTPEKTAGHRFRQHNVIQKTVREKNKTPGNK